MAVFKNTSGLQFEKIKKDFQKKFKNKGLVIIVNCNMKIVDYLDVMLDLHNRSYRPYKTPNEEANDILVKSDNHPCILKQLPMSIEIRLSSLPSSKDIFEETAPYYEEYLLNCGYKEKLYYRLQHLQIWLQKGNHKETFYGLTHLIVRQPKQKLVSSFCS